ELNLLWTCLRSPLDKQYTALTCHQWVMVIKTLAYGLLITALGLIGYFATGQVSKTALIPCVFGLPVILLAIFTAIKPGISKQTTIAALIIALLAFGGTVAGLSKLAVLLTGGEIERPIAIIVQSIMAIASLVYVTSSGLSLYGQKSR
ncbi:MAG: hypothetical protein AAFO95_08410, partial [Cyanobacteria bacterium J06600_6]